MLHLQLDMHCMAIELFLFSENQTFTWTPFDLKEKLGAGVFLCLQICQSFTTLDSVSLKNELSCHGFDDHHISGMLRDTI